MPFILTHMIWEEGGGRVHGMKWKIPAGHGISDQPLYNASYFQCLIFYSENCSTVHEHLQVEAPPFRFQVQWRRRCGRCNGKWCRADYSWISKLQHVIYSVNRESRENKTGEYSPHTGLCDVNRRSGAADMMWLLLREIQPAHFLLLGNLMTPQLLANNLQFLADPFPTAIGVDGRGEKWRPLLLIRGWIFLQNKRKHHSMWNNLIKKSVHFLF